VATARRPRVWECRLYPEPGRRHLYVRAVVFHRRKDMLEFWRLCDGKPMHARARCQEVDQYRFDKGKSRRKTGLIACVSLWRGEMGTATVTHEFTHATMAWARRRGLDVASIDDGKAGVIPQDHPEERIAEALGHLTSQFVARASASGLYPREAGVPR